MKKFKLLLLSAALISLTNFSFGSQDPKTQCLVSSDPQKNTGSCWTKSDGSGDACYEVEGTPACSGTL